MTDYLRPGIHLLITEPGLPPLFIYGVWIERRTEGQRPTTEDTRFGYSFGLLRSITSGYQLLDTGRKHLSLNSVESVQGNTYIIDTYESGKCDIVVKSSISNIPGVNRKTGKCLLQTTGNCIQFFKSESPSLVSPLPTSSLDLTVCFR